jgi:putative DNA primase/helicase
MCIDDPAVRERKRERLNRTWRESVSLTDTKAHAVRRYLEARALGEILKAPPRVLRAHTALEYWDGTQSLGTYPAMVALFAGAAGDPVTLHVTYLRADGCTKAMVPSPKKILGVPVRGATKGGAVRLFEARGHALGVAEGIESALSLHLIRKIPVWASFCADNLERIRLPDGLRELQIGVDMDASGKGEAVAKSLAQRVMRYSPRTRVLYIRPELDGPGDLNDELRRGAG